MEEEKKSGPSTISLMDLLFVLRHCWLFLIISALLASGGSALYLYGTHTDLYSATASLYVLRQTAKAYTETADVSIANNLIYDVADIVTSHDVLETVCENPSVKRTPSQLKNMVSVLPIPINTPLHIVEFTVTSTDNEEAALLGKLIVDATCDKMNDLFNGEQIIKPMYSVVVPTAPSNPVRKLYIAIAGFAAAVFCYTIFLLLHLLDGRIDSKETLERDLGITLLGEIPNTADAKRHQRKAGKYGKYYYYNSATKKDGEAK